MVKKHNNFNFFKLVMFVYRCILKQNCLCKSFSHQGNINVRTFPNYFQKKPPLLSPTSAKLLRSIQWCFMYSQHTLSVHSAGGEEQIQL